MHTSRRLAFLFSALATAAMGPALDGPQELAAQEWWDEEVNPRMLVEGVVVDHETGDSLSGATVSLGAGPGVRGRGTRVTDDEGRFSFTGVREGTYRLIVSYPGYRDMRDTLPVVAEGDLDLMLQLSTGSVHAPVVLSEGLSEAVPGYARRRAGGARFMITREDILEARPRYVTELLHRMPGGTVIPTPPYGYTLLLRGQCRPGIWVDAVAWRGATSLDQVLSPNDVEAVEVFHGFELPVEFGVDECGGILAWTRRGPPPSERSGDSVGSALGGFGKVLGVLAAVVVVVVLTR